MATSLDEEAESMSEQSKSNEGRKAEDLTLLPNSPSTSNQEEDKIKSHSKNEPNLKEEKTS